MGRSSWRSSAQLFPNLPSFLQWPSVYWGMQCWGEEEIKEVHD